MKAVIPRLLLLLILIIGSLIHISAQDVVAYYPFSGNTSDASGFGNDAQVNAASLTQDRFGLANSAFYCDGEQSFLFAPNADHLLTDLISVSVWVNVEEIPGQGEAYILSHGSWQERWKISLPDHGRMVFTTNADQIKDTDAGIGNEISEGVWTHIIMVHDGVNDMIYINGVLANSAAVTGNLNTTDKDFGMGYNIFYGGSYYKGSLDDVMIYDGALTVQQVADLYAEQSTAPVFDQGLVASYTFDDGLLDVTSFGNHGKGVDIKATTDRFGFGTNAYLFNGTSASINAANSAQLNSDYATVSFWINVKELPEQGEVYPLSFGGWQERWKVSLPDHGKPVWTTNHENGCCANTDSGDGNELVPGVWTHVAMVHDGAKDKVFINGVLANESDVVGKLNPTTQPLGIGWDPVDKGNYFNGSLDEIFIYNYGMTDQEIADLYNAQLTSNITETNLVANFPLTGNANDATQFENHGVGNGTVPTNDRFGYGGNAMDFDGTASINAPTSLQYNSDYATVSFWVNVGELPAQGEVYLLSFGGWQERWKVSLPDHGKPVWTTNHENGCCANTDSGDGNELVPGVWTHVAMVHDGAKDKVFINGVLANESDVVGKLKTTSQPLGIGWDPIDMGNYFTGALDEVQIYNEALTDQEIADLYGAQNMAPMVTDSLVADYPFSGNAYDQTPFKNHGRPFGALLTSDRFGRANHAYSFDGASGINADNSPQLNSPQASVSFWVNVNELPEQGEVYLLSFGGWQERWKISLPDHGKPVWTSNHENGCCANTDSGDGNELVPGVWTHVAMVHDGAKDKVFINGVLANESDVPADLKSTTHPLGIGWDPVDMGNYFNGSLDDVQIYNIGLTDQQVADLYAAQSIAPEVTDSIAPSVPLDLVATVSFTNVNLSWSPSTDNVGVTAYNVYQDSIQIMTTSTTEASITALAQLTTFDFGVTALDDAGNESAPTTITVTTGEDQTPDTIPPSVPANLQASIGSSSINFSWDASTDERAVAGYIVYLDGALVDTLPPDKTSVFISGLDPETLYTLEVLAFDLAGNESDLAELTVSTEAEIQTSEPGLVAYYNFDDGRAQDLTPFANHGQIGGNPIFETVSDRPNASGMAVVFDGDQDSILAPNAVQLISDYTTVSFWIRVDSQNTSDAEAYILNFGNWNERWKISLPQHLKIVWTTNSKNSQFDNAVSDMDSGDGNELVKGFWWHVTMVHDGENDIIYVDGVEVNRKPAPGTLNSTAMMFGMGNNNTNSGQYFIGALDEVKIYNKALTAEEASNLYETGSTPIQYVSEGLLNVLEVIYPNPVTNEVIIEHSFKDNQSLLVRVFDAMGRQLNAVKFAKGQAYSGSPITLNMRDYTVGTYYINFVYGGKDLGSAKIVKQ